MGKVEIYDRFATYQRKVGTVEKEEEPVSYLNPLQKNSVKKHVKY